ncbi:MAG: DUF86 domain-containing protein [Patescibacteria group bacterium]|nr:DUF86 domain-containing protein [Patescibacteria group bacterium]
MPKIKFLKSKEIKSLKEYFKKEKSVILAFLFGSFAKGFPMKESDVDVAVYLNEKLPLAKREKIEDKIWFEISEIIKGREVQLVCMNEAPATLISNIFKTGVPLVIKDKKLYWEFYLQKSSEAEDFLQFIEDFWRIYKKSKSLIPEEKARLRERLHFLDSELRETEHFKKMTFKEYRDEKDKRRNIERWTETIINATIDIAKMVLASEKKKMPRTYEEALLYFGILAGLNEKESEKLSEFANLRNILAHEYLDIIYKRIQNFIKEFPKFYKIIYNFLEKYLKNKS